jgi:hypothetical protein
MLLAGQDLGTVCNFSLNAPCNASKSKATQLICELTRRRPRYCLHTHDFDLLFTDRGAFVERVRGSPAVCKYGGGSVQRGSRHASMPRR